MMIDQIGVVVVNHNGGELTLACLRTVLATSWPPDRLAVVLVDNGSNDGIANRVRRELPGVEVHELGRNVGFGAACNVGIASLTDVDAIALGEQRRHRRVRLAGSAREHARSGSIDRSRVPQDPPGRSVPVRHPALSDIDRCRRPPSAGVLITGAARRRPRRVVADEARRRVLGHRSGHPGSPGPVVARRRHRARSRRGHQGRAPPVGRQRHVGGAERRRRVDATCHRHRAVLVPRRSNRTTGRRDQQRGNHRRCRRLRR